MNLLKVAQTFATEDQALDYLVQFRWPEGARCVTCGQDKCYRIDTKGKTGKPARLYECGGCGFHFSATTGTLFHDSHLPLTKWFAAIALMCEAKKGISAMQVQRHIRMTYKTTWHLCHRIRKAMEELNAEPLGSQGQIVEIDESYLGGKKLRKGVKAGKDAKIPILGVVERNGRIHMQKIKSAKLAAIKPVLDEKLSPNASKIVTDAAVVYAHLIPAEKHEETVHKTEIEKTGMVSMKTIEGAFSLFKRGVVGSYHKLSSEHLDSYLQEFSWRWNHRHIQPHMFDMMLKRLGENKPLPYKLLKGGDF